MSRRDVVRVTCDVCGRNLDVRPDEVDLTRYTVPVKVETDEMLGTRFVHMKQVTIDLCNACAGKLAIIGATPITEMRYDPTAFEKRPFPTGRYTYRFCDDGERE